MRDLRYVLMSYGLFCRGLVTVFLLMWLFCFQLERLYLVLYSRSFCSVQTLSSCCSKQFLIQVEEKEI